MAKRVLPVSESDLRMDGDLALSIQRVLPVTQADIDAAAALGEGWVVWRVIEVAEPLDNLRGGTLRVIKQNSVQPGQNVRRVLIVQGPSGEKVIVGPGVAPLSLPDAIADSLDYVKAYGGTEQRNVPDGYTELEYLIADGASYISTNYIPTPDSVVKTKIYATGTGAVFGSRWTPSPTYDTFGFIRTSSNFLAYYGRYSDGYYKSISANVDTLYDFVFDMTEVKLGNTTTSITREQFSATEPLCIGALNNVGTAGSFFTGRLYRLTISENGVVKADFIPCSRTADSVLGMYETVSGTFLTNDGTGAFAAGTAVSVSPDTPMGIWCNNGVLKLSPNLFDKSSMYIEGYLETSGSVIARNGYTITMPCEPNTTYTFSRQQSSGRYRCGCSSAATVTAGSTGITIISSAPVQSDVVLDTFTTTADAKTLVIWFTNTTDDAELQSQLNQIQVQKGSVATPYHAYKAIYADGTQETIGVSQLPVAYCELEYITATGTQYIDTGVKLNSGSRVEISFKSENISQTQALFGCRDSASGTRNAFAMWENVGSRMRFDYQSEGLGANTNISTVDWNLTIKDGVSNMLNGTSQPTNTPETFSGNYSAYIFSINTTGVAGNNMVGSIAYCKIWQDGVTLSFDGVPCVRRADGVVGMYDKVSGTFFTNAGTGNFVAGDVKAGTATCENLLSIGDYADVQEILSGNVTRKVGVKVFDGTENWSASTAYGGSFFIPIAATTWGAVVGENNLCTHFSRTVFNASNNHFYVVSSAFNDATAFKQFLAAQYAAGTPVTIIYPLAQTVTEQVAPQVLNVQTGDNILEITQASLSDLELEAEYQKSV